tara:strand:+ start:166 stop:378 length:213 start_codon:yes stop_codon:yes gene_type:complete
LASIFAKGAIINAATIATGNAKVQELKYLIKKFPSTPVLTIVTTTLIIALIPNAIISMNKVWEYFFESMI